MKEAAQYQVTHDEIDWNTTIDGAAHRIKIPIYHSAPDDSMPTVSLNGIGESVYSASVAPSLFANTYSPVLPFQGELKLTPGIIQLIASEVPQLVARFALERSSGHRKVNIIGRSQSGALAIRAVHHSPELFNRLALIMPFGLNQNNLGATPRQMRKTILTRLGIAALRANPFDGGDFRSSKEVMSYVRRAARDKTLFPSLDAALTFNMIAELGEVADTHDVALLASHKDPVFPANELAQNIKGSNVQLIEVVGTHATPGSRRGQDHLRRAFSWLKQGE